MIVSAFVLEFVAFALQKTGLVASGWAGWAFLERQHQARLSMSQSAGEADS